MYNLHKFATNLHPVGIYWWRIYENEFKWFGNKYSMCKFIKHQQKRWQIFTCSSPINKNYNNFLFHVRIYIFLPFHNKLANTQTWHGKWITFSFWTAIIFVTKSFLSKLFIYLLFCPGVSSVSINILQNWSMHNLCTTKYSNTMM